MTPQQFQQAHGEKLKAFLNEPVGQSLINVLASFVPLFSNNEIPHLFAKGMGEREGFERCIKTIAMLSQPPKLQTDIEANYGIPDAKK